MTMNRRSVLQAALAATAILPRLALAAFPERPLTIVTPFGAGSSGDIIGREFAARLSALLGQPVLIDLKTGAGTTLAAGHVARARPDGHTLLFASNSPFSIAPNVYASVPYDPQKDFTVIATLYSTVAVLLARSDFPAADLNEYLELTRRAPTKHSYASYGTGTSSHLMMEMLKQRTGAPILHVPYKSAAEGTMAVLGGFADVCFETVPSAATRVSSGQMKALAILGPKRQPAFPGVRTVGELGHPDIEIVATFAVVAPAGLPTAVIERLRPAIQQVRADPEFLQRLVAAGCEPLEMRPEAYAAMMAAESERVRRVVAALGLKL